MMVEQHEPIPGIQPTGVPHIGNYFGAISQWIELSNLNANEKQPDKNLSIFSIVDIHAYTSQRVTFGEPFYENILSTTAALLALGLNPNKCILFRQSDLFEHNYLDNVLDNFVSPNRLGRMTQFKEKSTSSKSSLNNGLLNYPVLQAADILLYKTNLVPVGEDQVQHIELTRDIARKFNASTNSQLFVEPQALLNESSDARRVKSLRNPTKKMSKSDPDRKSFIEVVDEPEVVLEKVKKSVTDCESAVYFDSDKRPGVSNLLRIHHLLTGTSYEQLEKEFKGIETANYKLRLADILIEKFRPARLEYKKIRSDRDYLEKVLQLGFDKARPLASDTITQVKHLLGSYRTR